MYLLVGRNLWQASDKLLAEILTRVPGCDRWFCLHCPIHCAVILLLLYVLVYSLELSACYYHGGVRRPRWRVSIVFIY